MPKTELKTLLNHNNIWTNTNSNTEVSYAVHDSAPIRQTRALMAANGPRLFTTTSSSFTTNISLPLKSLKVNFLPKQEGSGDPSPTNVRPITGWTDLSVYHSGENLYVPNIDNKGYINASGVIKVDTTSTYTDPIPVVVGDTYSFKCTTVNVNGETNRRIHGYDSNGDWVQQISMGKTAANTVEDRTILATIPSGISYIRVSFRNEDTNVRIAKENVYNVDWTSNGTIYRGYIDLISGELVQTWRKITLDGTQSLLAAASSYDGTLGTDCYINMSTAYQPAGNYMSTNNTISDKLKPASYAIWGTPNNYLWTNTTNGLQIHFVLGNATVGIEASDVRETRHTKINAWLTNNPIDIVYQLTTPITYQLTPTQIKSLLNQNNLWTTSNSSMEIKYWKH